MARKGGAAATGDEPTDREFLSLPRIRRGLQGSDPRHRRMLVELGRLFRGLSTRDWEILEALSEHGTTVGAARAIAPDQEDSYRGYVSRRRRKLEKFEEKALSITALWVARICGLPLSAKDLEAER